MPILELWDNLPSFPKLSQTNLLLKFLFYLQQWGNIFVGSWPSFLKKYSSDTVAWARKATQSIE